MCPSPDRERVPAPLRPHDHAVHIYGSPRELIDALGRFLLDTLEQGGLAVFIHACDTDEEAWAVVDEALPLPSPEDRRTRTVVSRYEFAFQGDSLRIDEAHVARVLDDLHHRARELGLQGVNIFVDASRAYFSAGRADEWFRFEEWLGRRLSSSVALVCAYAKQDIETAERFVRVLKTHSYRFDHASTPTMASR